MKDHHIDIANKTIGMPKTTGLGTAISNDKIYIYIYI